MINRRKFLQASVAAGLATSAGFRYFIRDAYGYAQIPGLSDPAAQPKFAYTVPDALAPGFKYIANAMGEYKVKIREAMHMTGLINPMTGVQLTTPIWGYDDGNQKPSAPTWPGKTFEVQSVSAGGAAQTQVSWYNKLKRKNGSHLLPVDTNLHWCYSLGGYTGYSIKKDGVPIITHLHGGHSNFQFDGNPEFFHAPGEMVVGPQWDEVDGGFTNMFLYDNDVPAGNLWYHDHALGITRLNVYAGLAGFYFVRDEFDTGDETNTLGLPYWPYEKAYAIQDRMFRDTGELFYSAYPGDPFYEDFIDGEGAELPDDLFPDGGPTALAEFFGDHMVVNGVIWPYEPVEPRPYRLHLLNGTDSRFMQIEFRATEAGETNPANGEAIDFTVIGSDQGLAAEPTTTQSLLFEPGSRYDLIVDFSTLPEGAERVIMTNVLGDAPYGGDLPDPDPEIGDVFVDRQTDRVMAFDVTETLSAVPIDAVSGVAFGPQVGTATRTRKVALFEGMDEFGRLQPLLGTAEPALAADNATPIEWPNEDVYSAAGLVGQMQGSIAWHSPTTERPALGSTEEWEIYNVTGDAHPVHLHLVNFEVLGRNEIMWDSNTIAEGEEVGGVVYEEGDRFFPNPKAENPAGNGAYLEEQATVQHNSDPTDLETYGKGFRIMNATYGAAVPQPAEIVENTPKDMVTALPGQVTRIKATFDKPGRYVWHCHILSHEDHEMMRVLQVDPPPGG